MRKYLNLLILAMLLALPLCVACDGNDDDDVKTPDLVSNSLNPQSLDVSNVRWEQDGRFFKADCQISGADVVIWFTSEGVWAMTDYELLTWDDVPAAVQDAFRECEYTSWSKTRISRLEYLDNDVDYVIEVGKGKEVRLLMYREDGTLCKEAKTIQELLPIVNNIDNP